MSEINSSFKQEVEKKASILIDALPYIRDFSGKIVVICYCCSNLLSAKEEQLVMQDIALLKSIGMRPIVVHDTRFGADKYRENKRIAKLIELCGIKAVGICGIDLQTLKMTIDNGYIPVVTPNDIDTENMILYPENIACEIAHRMGAEKLVYLSEDKGLIEAMDEEQRIIPNVSLEEAEAFAKKNKFPEAFERRLKNAILAVERGVNRVHIVDGCIEHSLLLEFFSIDGVGTVIMKDHNQYYAHEKGGKK
jgi:acetylglutamate kinase